MLDLTRAGSLSDRVAVLTAKLRDFVATGPAARDLVAEVLWNANTEIDKPYVDIADVCLGLLRECGDRGVSAAARELGDFVIAPPINVQRDGGSPGEADEPSEGPLPRYPFVTASGRNAAETARLGGVSLYAPHVAPDFSYDAVKELYQQFRFVELTGWDALIHALVDDVNA